MTTHAQAEENLKIIRSLMERGTLYRTISVPSAFMIGSFSLLGGFIQMRKLIFNWENDYLLSFLLLWIIVFVLIGVFNFYWLVIRNRGEIAHYPRIKKAITCMLPSGLAGLLFTWSSFQSGALLSMISVWMIFYGLGLLSTMVFAPRSILFLGWSFLLSGFVTFILKQTLEPFSSSLIMITFGFYHLIYAFFTRGRN
ncbi:MAG: hypothetical protein K1X66_05340 [Verrucomicrobiae bacterium]|nr:hypothetical protein [Verrucomicrobiae bacterium]